MKSILMILAVVTCDVVQAQTSGTMQIQLEVLPRVLSVSVSSSQLDFAGQRADAGTVTLDPATGLANQKAAGPHAVGEVVVEGPAASKFLISLDHTTSLKQIGGLHEVDFTPTWAQSRGCGHRAFVLSGTRQGDTGILGEDGCATLRFGGTVDLTGTPQGRYAGQIAVRIIPL